MSGGDLEAYPLGFVRCERVYRCLHSPAPCSYAMEIELAVLEEDCCYTGTQCWCAHHRLRNFEEYLRYSRKYTLAIQQPLSGGSSQFGLCLLKRCLGIPLTKS